MFHIAMVAMATILHGNSLFSRDTDMKSLPNCNYPLLWTPQCLILCMLSKLCYHGNEG